MNDSRWTCRRYSHLQSPWFGPRHCSAGHQGDSLVNSGPNPPKQLPPAASARAALGGPWPSFEKSLWLPGQRPGQETAAATEAGAAGPSWRLVLRFLGAQ